MFSKVYKIFVEVYTALQSKNGCEVFSRVSIWKLRIYIYVCMLNGLRYCKVDLQNNCGLRYEFSFAKKAGPK